MGKNISVLVMVNDDNDILNSHYFMPENSF